MCKVCEVLTLVAETYGYTWEQVSRANANMVMTNDSYAQIAQRHQLPVEIVRKLARRLRPRSRSPQPRSTTPRGKGNPT
jgi:hypothetical protein